MAPPDPKPFAPVVEAFRHFTRHQTCAVMGRRLHNDECTYVRGGGCQACHWKSKRGRGDILIPSGHGNLFPLCHAAHIPELHTWGVETFEEHYDIDLEMRAEDNLRRWLASLEVEAIREGRICKGVGLADQLRVANVWDLDVSWARLA